MVTQALSPFTTQLSHRARNFADVVAVAVAAGGGSESLGLWHIGDRLVFR